MMHHRTSPREHRFINRIFMFCVDLDELAAMSKRLLFFGHNRFNLYSFYDRDHLAEDDCSTKEKALKYARENGVETRDNFKVQLITLPRIAGYIFNPVSFYFIFNEEKHPVCAIAEVSNTYREMKPYLLTSLADGRFLLRVPKFFYVSPFSSLELEFDFKLGLPGEQLEIQIDEYDGEKRILASSLSGRAQPFTNRKLCWYSIKYPLLTLKIITLIHWNAMLLYFKGIKHHPKADDLRQQRNLCRTSKTTNHSSCK